jgi:hypothetical protein
VGPGIRNQTCRAGELVPCRKIKTERLRLVDTSMYDKLSIKDLRCGHLELSPGLGKEF